MGWIDGYFLRPSRMVKKYASFVLALLPTTINREREVLGNDKTPATKPAARRVLARQGWASENDGLFEHLVRRSGMILGQCVGDKVPKRFFNHLLGPSILRRSGRRKGLANLPFLEITRICASDRSGIEVAHSRGHEQAGFLSA